MLFVQGSCDEQQGRGNKLECAHSCDFRRQPGTIQGEWRWKRQWRKNIQPSVQPIHCLGVTL